MEYSTLFIGDFLSILYEALPFIILGAIIAGFLEELVPQRFFANIVPKNRYLAIGLSALLGLVFPMCECGIVPVMRRLLRKGLPLSSCVAYMNAGPIINVVVIASTYAAFAKHVDGYWIIGFRILIAFLVAFGTALVVDRLYRKYGNELLTPLARPAVISDVDEEGKPAAKRTFLQRLNNITETALHDFVDITLFLILGALIASFIGIVLHKNDVADLSQTYPVLAILIMMVMAVLLCLCSEADAFVAASFITLHPAAKLAFLVLGPMLDIKLFLMFTRVFRMRLIRTIVICLVVQVFLYSLAVYYFWDSGAKNRVDQLLRPVAAEVQQDSTESPKGD